MTSVVIVLGLAVVAALVLDRVLTPRDLDKAWEADMQAVPVDAKSTVVRRIPSQRNGEAR